MCVHFIGYENKKHDRNVRMLLLTIRDARKEVEF